MTKISHFTVEKPKFNKNAMITTLAKYIVLAIATFLGVLIVVSLNIRKIDISFELFILISFMITLYIAIRHFLRKFRLSDIYDIQIDYETQELRFKSIDRLKGRELNKVVKFSDLKLGYAIQNGNLFGKQRVFNFFEKSKLYNTLNIDKTAWARMTNIDKMIHELSELGDLEVENNPDFLQEDIKYR